MTTLAVNLPRLYPEQRAAFYNDARYSVCEACTKAGKTVGALVWQMDQCLSDPMGRNHWWIAPVYPQAEIGFRRAKRMLADMISDGNARKTDDPMKIEFRNGAMWWFKSGEKPDNLYGEDVASAVGDEFTRMREQAWWAIRSTVTATEGSVRLIGNVKGRGNWGYRLARKAQDGEPGFSYHKITADHAIAEGVITQEEVDDAQRVLPHAVFRELYYCEPSDDGGNPFGLGAIESCLGPLSQGDPVAWGVDLAKSVDWTVCIGLDAQGDVCRFERWQRVPWRETITRIVDLIGDAPTLADSTGVGDAIVEDLQDRCAAVEAFKFTSQSKQQIMEGLAKSIQSGEVGFPEGPISSELGMFEFTHTRTGVRYEAPEGCHDDCVDALALAVEMLRRTGRMVAPLVVVAGARMEPREESARGMFERMRGSDPDWGF